jgi:hypothetical protein
MKRRFAVAILLPLSCVFGGEPGGTRPEPAAVRTMIRQLGEGDYRLRETATTAIAGWTARYPRFLLQQMAEVYPSAGDVEIATRLERLMEAPARELVLGIPPGFIGINMTWSPLEDGGSAIEIQSVLAGFPGEDAGLQVGDLVLSIDGKGIGEFVELTGFIDYVSSLPPGTPVDLLLQRGALQFMQTLILGSRPDAVARGGTRQAMAAVDAYEDWLQTLKGNLTGVDPEFPVGHFPSAGSTD